MWKAKSSPSDDGSYRNLLGTILTNADGGERAMATLSLRSDFRITVIMRLVDGNGELAVISIVNDAMDLLSR